VEPIGFRHRLSHALREPVQGLLGLPKQIRGLPFKLAEASAHHSGGASRLPPQGLSGDAVPLEETAPVLEGRLLDRLGGTPLPYVVPNQQQREDEQHQEEEAEHETARLKVAAGRVDAQPRHRDDREGGSRDHKDRPQSSTGVEATSHHILQLQAISYQQSAFS